MIPPPMDPKEFFNIKNFLSTPIKRQSLSTKKNHDSRPTHSQTTKSRAQKISSIFNRTFFISMQNTSKGAINLKLNPKCKTQQSILEQKDKKVITQKKEQKPRSSKQKMVRQNTDPNQNCFLAQGVKTRALTFEYYYKKIKRSQKQQKKQLVSPQESERRSSLNISRQYASNLSQQMLENMKKYIKKGQKIAQIHGKYSGDTSPHYGLDIKAIEAKKPEFIDEELLNIKEMKKHNMSSLFTAKKPYKPNKDQKQETEKNHGKDRRVLILQGMLCHSKQNKNKASPQKLQILAQKTDQKIILTRLQGMIINLNLVLNSFKCIWVKQASVNNFVCKSPKKSQKSDKYTYFIGYGNNKNLIRSIMKKRWWWTEVYNINEANFVWTQLKVSEILEQMQSCCRIKKQAIVKEQSIDEKEQMLEAQKSTLETLSKAQISLKRKSKQLNNQYLDYLMKKENLQKLNWIFHEETPVESIQVQSRNSKQNCFNFSEISPPKTVHNHFRLNYMFGNKNALFHNLREYFEFMEDEESLYKFIPKTYYIEKQNKVGIKDFYQRQFTASSGPKQAKGKSKNIWIVKPAQNSNRGQGISVHSSFESIRKQLASSKKGSKFIVQSYLRNLFLYQKRKFDIRAYLLMVRMGSTTKYYWYNEGYIRTSSEYYNTNDIDNIYIHLTNDAIQCDSQKYGKFEPGNKLSYSQFQRYLDTNYVKEKHSIDSLNESMKQIATQAVRSIHPKVKSHTVDYTFELFGLDFLIDSNFQPWLLEINTNPCLELACPVLQRLIPRMLQNMFRLCLDTVFQPNQEVSKASSYFIYDNLFDINRFELVFDSNYDENEDYMSHCQKLEEKVYADDNQVFENDGEQMNVEI